jgi:hypothetical protein
MGPAALSSQPGRLFDQPDAAQGSQPGRLATENTGGHSKSRPRWVDATKFNCKHASETMYFSAVHSFSRIGSLIRREVPGGFCQTCACACHWDPYIKGGSVMHHHSSRESSDANRKNRLMTAMGIPAPPGPHQRPTYVQLTVMDGVRSRKRSCTVWTTSVIYKNPLNSIYTTQATSKQASNTINHKP